MTESTHLEGKPSKPVWRRWYVLAVALVFVLGLAGFAWWYFQKPEKLNVWHPATVPYSAKCEGGCKPWRTIAPAHGGAHLGTPHPPQLVFNPKIDDPVAQWADCLQSINACMMKLKGNDDKGFRHCVAVSVCPAACKDRFAAQAGADMDTSARAYYAVFTDRDAVCRPEDTP